MYNETIKHINAASAAQRLIVGVHKLSSAAAAGGAGSALWFSALFVAVEGPTLEFIVGRIRKAYASAYLFYCRASM